jgi:hypothetical protein
MKIHQLPFGARFEYEGREYVKTGPLFGTCDGSQRLIPKYAVLRPLDGAVEQKKASRETVRRTDVAEAFDVFCRQCGPLVPDDRQTAFEKARAGFLAALDS